MCHRGPREVEDAVHIDAHDTVEVDVARSERIGTVNRARRVHQDVDLTMALDDAADRIVAEGRVTDIANMGRVQTEFVGNVASGLGVDVDRLDNSAPLHEGSR